MSVKSIIQALMLLSTAFCVSAQTDNYDEDVYFILSGEADKAISEGKYITAIARIKEALEIDPSNPSNVLLMSNLGMLYSELGEDSLALQTLDQAHAIAPAMVTVISNRARIHLKMGNDKKAYDDFGEVIARDSCDAGARYYHGLLSLWANDTITALRDFEVLSREAPDSYETNVAMAVYNLNTGHYRQAVPYYKKLLKDDDSAEYYEALAQCYLMMGELSDASNVIAEGINKYKNDAELYYLRAWLNRDSYLHKDARRDAEKAIKLGADRDRVRKLLD